MDVSSKVPASFTGMPLLDYLTTRFTYLPKADWQQFVQEGRVSRNGVLCDGATAVAQGDTIRCDLPDFAPPDVNLAYQIVYQDAWLLAVNKPGGLRVHSRGKFVNANLIYHLRHVHQPAYPEADLVNRLDADTSGLVLLARDKQVLAHLSHQFREGLVDKRYLAVVNGRPSPAQGTIDLPIGPVKNAQVPRFEINQTNGKTAVTHYQIIRPLSDEYTLLELNPQNGRTHQLRVHLAAIGHAIAGDARYTMNDADYLDWRRQTSSSINQQRQALHCHQLQFTHPIHKATCTLTAPLAPDIMQIIQSFN